MSRLALLNGSPVRSRPFPEWPICQPSDEEALLQVLRSGQWSRHQGHRTELFESRFASYQGARFGIGVVNGTIALRLALQTIGIQPGDEVIVPPITFYSTASSVIEVNGVPIFADIDPETYCIDPAAIEAAITSRTRAIIPVHFGGQSAAMDEIIEIARRNQLVVIEDAAHAHGAEYKGKRLGSLGQISAFSFQASKTLSAGEGGIILTSDEHYERICRALHTCGRFPDSAWYEHRILGGNYRMSEFQAALLLTQFNRLEEQVKVREANGLFLNRALAQIPGIKPMARGRGETRHGYYLYIFRYNPVPFDGLPRQTFLKALSAEGIPCSSGYDRPLYQQPVFIHQEFGPYRADGVHYPDYAGISCPTSEQSCQEACWLAQPVLLGDQGAMQDIVTAVSKIYEHRKDLLEMSVNMN
jgi:dTDP-4-amino-4,6-dideoxygalactose transaminase